MIATDQWGVPSTTVTYSISVTAGNTPPTITGTFASQSVSLGNTVAYTLPVFTDAQSDPITVTAFEGTTPLTPSSGYVTFNSATKILTFAPTAVLDIGTKTINIFAGDGLATSTWSFSVTVYNTLPSFSVALANQPVAIGSTATYTMPAIIDPDLLQIVTSSVNIPGSTPPGLVSYASNSFTINALGISTGSYPISVTLYDGYQSQTFSFNINVGANTPPIFTSLPKDQHVI